MKTVTEVTERIEEAPPRRFCRYAVYKGSGVEWLGEIPMHWSALPIKRVCRLCYGESLAGNDRVNGEVVVFGSNGPVGTHDTANTEAPCLIVGRKGSFGKVNYSADAVFAIDTTFVIDARYTQTDMRWLYYTLQCARLDTISKDSAIPGLDREDAYARVVALGPIHEQRDIAGFLDRETAKIDGLVARKERLIKLLQEKRTSIITRAVTRGLDPNVSMKDSGVEWLGEIPAHWEVKRLKYQSPGATVGIVVTPSKYYVDEGVPCLRSLNVSSGSINMENLVYISENANELHRKSKIFAGDVVVVRTGQAGTAAVVPQELDGANCIDLLIVRRSEELLSRFVYYYLNSNTATSQAEELSVGAIQAHYNTSTLTQLVIPKIPTDEQRRIVIHLDAATAKIDALIAKIHQAIDHLKEFRTALISAAVTGKIDVRGEAS